MPRSHTTGPGTMPTRRPRATLVAGDFDNDNDVDQEDFGHLQACFSGSGLSYSPGCEDADLDLDGDVDQQDLMAFASCQSGAGQSPACE